MLGRHDGVCFSSPVVATGRGRVAIETANNVNQLYRFPGWRLHRLKGELRGFWSLTVSGIWRIIFFHDQKANAAIDIDVIDYH